MKEKKHNLINTFSLMMNYNYIQNGFVSSFRLPSLKPLSCADAQSPCASILHYIQRKAAQMVYIEIHKIKNKIQTKRKYCINVCETVVSPWCGRRVV